MSENIPGQEKRARMRARFTEKLLQFLFLLHWLRFLNYGLEMIGVQNNLNIKAIIGNLFKNSEFKNLEPLLLFSLSTLYFITIKPPIREYSDLVLISAVH